LNTTAGGVKMVQGRWRKN